MLELKNICKEIIDEYGIKKIILRNISLKIEKGKIFSIIAPLDAGKTSLLKIVAGMDLNFSGTIDNKIQKIVILIPTKPSSFPWLNVKDNILFKLKNIDQKKYNRIIELVDLDGYELHSPNNKSLGFRFRISLARALMRDPELILLDESFTNMGSESRSESYFLIKNINKETGISFLLATSNLTEAIFLSDKIYLMKKNPGEIIGNYDVDFERDNLEMSKPFLQLINSMISTFKSIDGENLLSELKI